MQARSRKWGEQLGLFIAMCGGLGMASGVMIAGGSGHRPRAAIGAAAGVVVGSVYSVDP